MKDTDKEFTTKLSEKAEREEQRYLCARECISMMDNYHFTTEEDVISILKAIRLVMRKAK